MTDKIESQGKTVDDAVNEALLQMGARRDEVKVEVLEEGKSGLFGLIGGKRARVLVSRKSSRGGRGRRDYRENNRDAVTHQLSDEDERGGSRRGGRGRSRGGRGRGGEQQDQDRQQQNEARNGQERQERGGQGQDRQKADEGGSGRSSRRRGRRGGRRRDEDRTDRRDDQRQGGRGGARVEAQDGQAEQASRDDRSGRSRDGERSAEGRGGEGRSGRGRSRRGRRRSSGRQDDRGGAEARRDDERQDGRQDGRRGQQESAPRNNAGRDEKREPRRRSRRAQPDGGQDRPAAARAGDHGEDRSDSRSDSRSGNSRSGNSNNHADSAPAAARVDDRNASVEEIRMEKTMGPEEIIVADIPATRYAEPLRGVTDEELDQALFDLTNGMLIRAGFPVRCEVKPGEYRQIRIVTDDSSAGMLIGRHGSAVDSIEHLVERMAGIAAGDRVKMNLDINNYRRRRQDTLHDRVADAIETVMEQKKPFHMETMNPRERRMVHLQVEPVEGVRTFTIGGGGGKHVVIAPDDSETPESGDASPSEAAGGDARGEEAGGSETQPRDEAAHFEDADDGPQPMTNELVVEDDETPHKR